jgi:glycosyltransferase involved in cell wall biosynthesis
MRIVHVISGYLPHETAGTQIILRDLCRVQRARGHDPHVFTRISGREHSEFELSRAEWERTPVTRITNNFDDVDRFELLYTHAAIDAKFDEFLSASRPDVVHVHHLTCLSTSMIQVARRREIPVVMGLYDYWMVCLRGQRIRPDDLGICETLDRARCLTCLHKLWPHLLPIDGPRSLLDRLLGRAPSQSKLQTWERHVRGTLDQCQALTALSAFHRDRFVEWGADPNRIFVAPPGVVREPVPSRSQPDSFRHIGFIGTVIPSKGVHVLCEAFNRLGRRDVVLDIFGEIPSFHGDTTYEDRLRQIVAPGLTVRFHGKYEHGDLPTILASLDVLVVPSLWWESYCLTAREGALAGLPVIASELGALEDAVESGIAIGFRAGDAAQLTAVLERVLANPPEAHAARALAERSVLTLEASADRIDEIYRFAMGADGR